MEVGPGKDQAEGSGVSAEGGGEAAAAVGRGIGPRGGGMRETRVARR